MVDRGERDARYIRRLLDHPPLPRDRRRLGIYAVWRCRNGRAAGWALFWPVMVLGVLMGAAKILENMEIGHNVLHAQGLAARSGNPVGPLVGSRLPVRPVEARAQRQAPYLDQCAGDADVAGYGLLRMSRVSAGSRSIWATCCGRCCWRSSSSGASRFRSWSWAA
jgi:linoleoyl-CoA desaturase